MITWSVITPATITHVYSRMIQGTHRLVFCLFSFSLSLAPFSSLLDRPGILLRVTLSTSPPLVALGQLFSSSEPSTLLPMFMSCMSS